MTEKNGDLLKGLFIGGLIGIVLGILFAPKSGKETREDLNRKANDLLAKAKNEYENITEKGKQVYEESLNKLKALNISAKGTTVETEHEDGDLSHHGAETIDSNKSRFKKAIDAGLEAYRQESSKDNA